VVIESDSGVIVDTSIYRTNKPSEKVKSVPSYLFSKLSTSPEEALKQVVEVLMKGEEDPFIKVKIIHDWIIRTVSFDLMLFKTGKTTGQAYDAVLKSKKALSSGYSTLFEKMCSLAEIEAMKIDGIVRSYGYNPIDGYNLGYSHSWNSVYLLGKWYLLDIAWDSCITLNCGQCTEKREYSTKYFLLEPDIMIYTHFPNYKKWQLRSKSIAKADFYALPALTSDFFKYVSTIDDEIRSLNQSGRLFEFKYSLNTKSELDAFLVSLDGMEYESAVTKRVDMGNGIMKIIFPKPGKYILYLMTGDAGTGTLESSSAVYFDSTF